MSFTPAEMREMAKKLENPEYWANVTRLSAMLRYAADALEAKGEITMHSHNPKFKCPSCVQEPAAPPPSSSSEPCDGSGWSIVDLRPGGPYKCAGCIRCAPSSEPSAPQTEERCEGHYPVPYQRSEPFAVTYRCALPSGHVGPHGDGNRPQPIEAESSDRSQPIGEPREPHAALIASAPILSKYHGQRGFEVERFITDYEAWRAKCRAAFGEPREPHAADAARQFMRGEISSGRFAELLGLGPGEKHRFKQVVDFGMGEPHAALLKAAMAVDVDAASWLSARFPDVDEAATLVSNMRHVLRACRAALGEKGDQT